MKRKLLHFIILLALVLPRAALAAPGATDRAVHLEGTGNTRDLGGLPAAGGTVRRHMIYRSGALCFINAHDEKELEKLGIRTLVDLRRRDEIAKDGEDRYKGHRHLYLPMANKGGKPGTPSSYDALLRENPQVVKAFFEALSQRGSYPLLFHCSAGKDRTGILTALVLMLLGTPRDAIMDDYLQSTRNSEKLITDRGWLQAVFDDVDKAGGIEKFLASDGVSARDMSEVRALLIEPKKSI
jgi:protein tyrosine/serine phosphatase